MVKLNVDRYTYHDLNAWWQSVTTLIIVNSSYIAWQNQKLLSHHPQKSIGLQKKSHVLFFFICLLHLFQVWVCHHKKILCWEPSHGKWMPTQCLSRFPQTDVPSDRPSPLRPNHGALNRPKCRFHLTPLQLLVNAFNATLEMPYAGVQTYIWCNEPAHLMHLQYDHINSSQ